MRFRDGGGEAEGGGRIAVLGKDGAGAEPAESGRVGRLTCGLGLGDGIARVLRVDEGGMAEVCVRGGRVGIGAAGLGWMCQFQ